MSGVDRRLVRATLVALVVFVVDLATKRIVEGTMTVGQEIPVVPGFGLLYVRNSGAAFGLLSGAPEWLRIPLFLVVTVAALWLLVSYLRSTPPERGWVVVALGGIVGGALGNLACRLRSGEVVDFFHLHVGEWSWPMFNVADIGITLGVAVVLLESFRAPATGEAPAASPTTRR
ncbi:MAG: signal peptidase II [bacterium]|nr:signal peptidase II [bacterium]